MPSVAGQVEGCVVILVILIDQGLLWCGLKVKDCLDDLMLVFMSRQMDDVLVFVIFPLERRSFSHQELGRFDVTLGSCCH